MLIKGQLVEIKIRKDNLQYYLDLGYDVVKGDIIYVPPEHLKTNSNKIVQVICDCCGKRIDKPYQVYLKTHIYDMDVCCKCKFAKTKKTNIIKYGVEHPAQNDKVKEKTLQTCLKKYGGNGPMADKQIRLKSKKTCIEKYGVEHVMQIPEVYKERQQVILEKYGVSNISQSEEIKEKKKQTTLKHFGVEFPAQSSEIQTKIRKSLQSNGTVPTSKQQIQLYEMIKQKYPDAILNYPFGSCSLDIFVCINNINIDIEYDCQYWHDLNKDIKRDKFLQSNGFKIIRIRSKYLLPTENDVFSTIDYLLNTEHHFKEIKLSDWEDLNGGDTNNGKSNN